MFKYKQKITGRADDGNKKCWDNSAIKISE